jgi:hypothetical protein
VARGVGRLLGDLCGIRTGPRCRALILPVDTACGDPAHGRQTTQGVAGLPR